MPRMVHPLKNSPLIGIGVRLETAPTGEKDDMRRGRARA
jgi:hypothetical protein